MASEWISMLHGAQRTDPHPFGYPITFHVVLSVGQSVHLFNTSVSDQIPFKNWWHRAQLCFVFCVCKVTHYDHCIYLLSHSSGETFWGSLLTFICFQSIFTAPKCYNSVTISYLVHRKTRTVRYLTHLHKIIHTPDDWATSSMGILHWLVLMFTTRGQKVSVLCWLKRKHRERKRVGLPQGGGDIVLLTFTACPIIWGLLESRPHGVTMVLCCPTTD